MIDSGAQTEHFAVAGEHVIVNSDSRYVVEDMRGYFPPVAPVPTAHSWLFRCNLNKPPPSTIKQKVANVHFEVDLDNRNVRLWGNDRLELCAVLRRAVREIFFSWYDKERYALIHASAVRKDDVVIMFVGDSGSGKTTLALDCVFRHGFELIANDHVVITYKLESLKITGTPSGAFIKAGTLEKYKSYLSHVPGFSAEAEKYQGVSPKDLKKVGTGLYCSFRELGFSYTPVLAVNDTSVKLMVVELIFEEVDKPRLEKRNTDTAAACLNRHLLVNWLYEAPQSHPVLRLQRRSKFDFVNDARQLSVVTASMSESLIFDHRGDVEPLLTATGVL